MLTECFKDNLQFGLAEGCKEACWPTITECGTWFIDRDHLKYCVCSTDKCSGEDSFKGGSNVGGGSGGGNSNNKASSLRWNAIAAGFIMTSTLIAVGGL